MSSAWMNLALIVAIAALMETALLTVIKLTVSKGGKKARRQALHTVGLIVSSGIGSLIYVGKMWESMGGTASTLIIT